MSCQRLIAVICAVVSVHCSISTSEPLPQLVSLSPPSGAVAAIPTAIEAAFSAGVKPVAPDSFALSGTCATLPTVSGVTMDTNQMVATATLAGGSCTNGQQLIVAVDPSTIQNASGGTVSGTLLTQIYSFAFTGPTGPQLLSLSPSSAEVAAAPTSVTVAFSAAVAPLTAGNFALSGTCTTPPTVGTVTMDANQVVATATLVGGTCTNGQQLTVSVSPNSVQSASGGPVFGSTLSQTYTIDTVGPTVTLGTPSQSAINQSGTSSLALSISPSAAGHTSLTGALTGTGGGVTVDVVSGSPACNVSVTGIGPAGALVELSNCTGNGNVTVTVSAGIAVDQIGNASSASTTSGQIVVDNTAPTLISLSPPSGVMSASPTQVVAAFSEPIDSPSASVFALSGNCTTTPTATNITLDSTKTTVTAALSGGNCANGESLIATINPAQVADLAGNAGTGSSVSRTYTVDTSGPLVSVGMPSSTGLNSSGNLTIAVTIAPSTSGSTSLTGALTAAGGGVTQTRISGNPACDVAVSNISPTGAVITLSSCTGNGLMTVHVSAGIAEDALGNSSTVSPESSTINVDNTAPAIVSLTPPTAYVAQAPTTSAAAFSEAMTPVPTTAFQLGGTCTAPPSVTGVVMGNGNTTATATLNGGTCTNGQTLTVTLDPRNTYDAVGNQGMGTITQTTYTVDTIGPTASLASPSSKLINASGSTTIALTLTASAAGSTTLTGTLTPTGGGVTVNIVSGNPACTVTVSNVTATGASIGLSQCSGNGVVTVTVNGGIAQDSLGNMSNASSASTQITVDNVQPTISTVTPPSAVAKNVPTQVISTFSKVIQTPPTSMVSLGGSCSTLPTLASLTLDATQKVATAALSGGSCGDGQRLTVGINPNRVSDLAGNTGSGSMVTQTYIVDTSGPVASLGTPSNLTMYGSTSTTIALTLTTSAAGSTSLTGALTTNGGGVTQTVVSGAPSCNVAVSGITSTGATITLSGCSGNGTLTVHVNAAVAQDALGNSSSVSAETSVITVNTTPSTSFSTLGLSANPVTAGGNVTLTATLLDGGSAPVANQTVTFGTNAPAYTFSSTSAITDSTGKAQVIYNSPNAGTQTLSASFSSKILQTPLTVSTDNANALVSVLATPPSSILANGVAQASFTATILDVFGNPVSGLMPSWSATGSNNLLTTSGQVTNANGKTTATLASITDEVKSVQVQVTNATLTGSVTFVPTPSPTLSTLSVGSGTAPADGSSIPVTVTVNSYAGNPIPGVVVKLASSDVFVVPSPRIAATSSSGVVSAALISHYPSYVSLAATFGTIVLNANATFTSPSHCTGGPSFAGDWPAQATGLSPYSAALGDLNGDSKLDLAVANSGDGTLGVLLGNGDGTFQPQVAYATGATPYSIAVGDLNGDNKLDLAVANSGGNTVGVLLGNGDGTYLPQVTYATGAAPYSVAIGDLNGDNKPDFAVANSGGNTVSVLLGNGDGTYQAQVAYGTQSQPWSVAIGDVNGDNSLDLAVANFNSNSVTLLLNNGNGTFRAAPFNPTKANPSSVAIADLNGDNKPDLVATDNGTTFASVFLNTGNGTYTQGQVTYGTGGGPYAVAVGDLNGDSKPDLVTTNQFGYFAGTVSVLMGNGNGTFKTQVMYPTGASPYPVVIGDLNGDSKLDLAVANASGTVSVLLGNGDGTFKTVPTYETNISPQSIAIGDFDSDGKPDYVVAASDIWPMQGNGDGTFSGYLDVPTGGNSVSVAVGDLNGDGKPDLATANIGGTVSVMLGNGNFTFQNPVSYTNGSGSNPSFVIIADFNADGKQDVAVACQGYGAVNVFLGNGNGTLRSYNTYLTGTAPLSVAAGDLNGDGKLDLAAANSGGNTVSVLLGNGSGAFATQLAYAAGPYPFSVSIGDLNGDAKLDLAVANKAGNTVSVLLGNGDGTVGAQVFYSTGLRPTAVAIGDFNGDTKPDLATTNSGNSTLGVSLGNGDGTFNAQVLYATGGTPWSVATSDFNLDTKVDLAVANLGSASVTVLLSSGCL